MAIGPVLLLRAGATLQLIEVVLRGALSAAPVPVYRGHIDAWATRTGQGLTLRFLRDQTVHVTGDLDMATSPEFFAQVRAQYSSGVVTLDLSDLAFIDASGLRVIVELRRVLISAGGRLRLAGVRPRHGRVFLAAGLAALI